MSLHQKEPRVKNLAKNLNKVFVSGHTRITILLIMRGGGDCMADDSYNCGRKIRELREAMHLSQAALAKKSKVSRSAINRYELDKGIPDADRLVRLALALNTTIDYLLDMPDAPTIKFYDITPEQQANLKFCVDFIDRVIKGK